MDPHSWVTAEWLTEALHSSGNLAGGAVAALAAETFETPPSVLMRLTLRYTENAPASAPCHLLLKMPKPHKINRLMREVRFYNSVAPLLGSAGLVRCFASSVGNELDLPWLLLEDVSATHYGVAGSAVTASDLVEIAQALAGLHAALWDHPELEKIAGMTAENTLWDNIEGNDRRYTELLSLYGSHFPNHWKSVYKLSLEAAPALLLARTRRGALTLCHPDAHLGNFLLPRNREDAPALIVDWHDYQNGWGAGDLARLLMVDPNLRRQCERQVLQSYLLTMCAAGVTNYDWSTLWEDYRLSALYNLFVPLGNRRQPWVWTQIKQVVSAFDDLKCYELLQDNG